jgi:hypothetical protein
VISSKGFAVRSPLYPRQIKDSKGSSASRNTTGFTNLTDIYQKFFLRSIPEYMLAT